MKKQIKKLKISNGAWKHIQSTRHKCLTKGIVYLILSALFAIGARVVVDNKNFIVLWVYLFVLFHIFAFCTAYQLLCYVLMFVKPLLYKHSINNIVNDDILTALSSAGKVLHKQNGKAVIKTTLLNSKIIIGCFDVLEDNKLADFSKDILLARTLEKQRRNIGYVIIFNIKSSTFDIRKLMKQQTLDNYALCDLRCFYFAEDQELITVYDKKSEFCKQITEQFVRLLNSLETVDVISDKDNQQ